MLMRMSACVGLGWCILLGIRADNSHGLGGKIRISGLGRSRAFGLEYS